MADQNLKILIDSVFSAKGFEQANKSIGEVDNGTKKLKSSNDLLSSSFSSLGGILATVGFATLAKEAIQMADTYKLMSARLSLVTDSTKEFVTAQSKIFAMSQETRSSLEATTSLYTKLAMSTESMGKSQDQILTVTKAVNESMKISGATTQEATATVLQLGQALQSGKLQGDEYRSLRENAPRLAKAIADGMGVEIGALKELSTQGKLTAEVVFAAIEKSGAKLDEEFKKIPATVGDAFTILSNDALKLVGDLDSATGASSSLSSSMIDFSKTLNDGTSDIVSFGQFTFATLDRTKDMFMLVGITAKNTVELAIGGIAGTVYGAMSSITDMILYATKGLNSIGLSSDANLASAQSSAATMKKLYRQSVDSINEDWNDINNAVLKASPTVEDRISQMNRLKVATKSVNDEAKKTGLSGETNEQKKAREKAAKDALKAEKEAHDDRVKAMAEINKATARAQQYQEFQTKVIEDRAKLEFQADQDRETALKTYNDGLVSAQIETYTAMGDITSAYYLQEEEKMKKLADTGWYTNEQMLAIKTKDNEKFQKEQWDRDNKFWADTFVNINKAMDDQFFNAMSGKFTSFGDWLKDFWGSITQSMTRGLSKSLADTIMGTGNNSEGGIANWFKSYGGFSGVMGSSSVSSALRGSTYDPVSQMTTTTGGTVLDSVGQVVTAGSDVANILNATSTATGIASLYAAGTAGLSAGVAQGFGYLAMGAQSGASILGASSATAGAIGGNIANFGAGFASPFSGFGTGGAAGYGAMAGGAVIGGVGGYALGSIGDKLLGADTKAANYGAIGGATGAIVGSVVPVIGTAIGAVVGATLGSLIGGAFGSKKTSVTGSGVQFWDEGSASNINASSYVDKMEKKKSWFKSSERYWTEYAAISESDQLKIKKTFDVYNYLLLQLDKSADVSIAAGKYSGQTFQDAMAKGFITNFTNINTSSPEFAKIYSYWITYASEVSKTVAEALTASVGEYITTTRSFNEWKLGSGSMDQLKFTADYLAKDFNILSESMGVSGLTVENYLQKYDEAIKTSFSPETITTWKNLGNALMSATDANTKYTESLKNVQATILPQDMNLSKGLDATQIYQTITTQNDTLKYSFAEMISVLRNILYNQQFNGLNVGIPA